ncbi:MAG TPA: hypothetical protein PJ988_16200 [Anaerolinea sp.]|nr:hypothetical protein [Anaerolinea sp.]
MATSQSVSNSVDRFQWIAFLVGLVGLVAGVAGALTGSMERFFQAYLVAFLFWLGLSLGSLALLMIFYLTGGRWGLTMRRVNEAAASTLWLMAALFIPLLFNLRGLYLWARPEAVQADAILQQKSVYLNVPFFIIRAAVYFALWILLAYTINRLSARWVNSGDPNIKGRLQGLGAIGLILYTLTMSFAAIDWMMSLEPFWSSTVYGLIVILGQLLSSLAFALLILNLVPGLGLSRQWNFRTTPIPFKDLGGLLLTFVMGWAYLAYFQLLIIWAGNIPHEVVWYYNRTQGGWLTVGILVAVLLFVLPFMLLLAMRVRNNLRLLAWLGALIVVAYLINLYWEVIPAFHPGQFNLHWLDVVSPVGIGGLWVGAFLFALKHRPALRKVEEESFS